MSRTRRPATASSGTAQNGWIMLVHWSPYAIAMITTDWSTPWASAAPANRGAISANWPPPEGTNMLSSPAERKASTPSVPGLETSMKNSLMISTRPVAPIIPMMPA